MDLLGRWSCAGVSLAVLLCLWNAHPVDSASHRYKLHDAVPLYANKIGPFQSPACVPSSLLIPCASQASLASSTQICNGFTTLPAAKL